LPSGRNHDLFGGHAEANALTLDETSEALVRTDLRRTHDWRIAAAWPA